MEDRSRVQNKVLKRIKMNAEDELMYSFDLSHIPLKENAKEFPLWVGDVKQKFYKKGNGYGKYKKSSEVSEPVILPHPSTIY